MGCGGMGVEGCKWWEVMLSWGADGGCEEGSAGGEQRLMRVWWLVRLVKGCVVVEGLCTYSGVADEPRKGGAACWGAAALLLCNILQAEGAPKAVAEGCTVGSGAC